MTSWGSWRRTIDVHGRPHTCPLEWRRPRLVLVRSAELHGPALNTYPGCVIGFDLPLPRLSRTPGWPRLSILWGRPGRPVEVDR